MSQSEETPQTSPFLPMFEVFRQELDEHHDRRERVIKASRDVTALSKKAIFALQRVRTLKAPIPPKIASEAKAKADSIQSLFQTLVPDLQGLNSWRYQRQVSGGIQEYMEYVSFEYYLPHQRLITLSEASALTGGIELTIDDYVLGLFDLIGELMRFAITTMATTGSVPSSKTESGDGGDGGGGRSILSDLREVRAAFERLDTTSSRTGLGKDVEKKMEVMRTCVEKVETAVYGMIVRGSERPKGWIPDLEGERAVVESY